jgi:PPP family 3-phenylpropionic acid transporter
MPYWRLSNFYFCYFATLGAFLPYWSLYLQARGFTAREIGELMATIGLTKVISPNLWGWVADHTGRRMLIVRIGCALALLSFLGVFVAPGYWWLLAVMIVYGFFWNAALPQFEATTLTHLGDAAHGYSGIRLWGSIGFILAVAVLGVVLEERGALILPDIVVVLVATIFLSSLWVPERAAGHLHLTHEPMRTLIKRPAVLGLLMVCFLMQASHGPYYAFYSIFLEEHHYSRTLIGQLWAFGVIAEVVLFVFMRKLIARYGLRNLLIASAALTSVRWLMIGAFVDNVPMIVAAQTLHAASFAIYHAVAIQLIHLFFTGRNQGRGQALYSSLSFGLGGALGTLYAGYTWESWGGSATFASSAVFSAIALVITWRYVVEPTTAKQTMA